MNRYTITYYTKDRRKIISPELISNLNEEEFIENISKNIKEKVAFIMKFEEETIVILTNNIESFKVTQY